MNLIKICILHLTAFILTIFLTLHHFITYLLLLSLHCLPLTLTKELSRLNRWGEESEKKVHGMQIIINSCVSMVSALVVVGYAEKFVSVAQWVSVEVHQYFLGQNGFSWGAFDGQVEQITAVYILLGYMGITVQLALTIDIIYLFTIPTILIYRALASLYKYLLIVIGFLFEVLSRDFERWVSCPFPQIKKAPNCAKTFSLALLIIFVKVLLFVAFYYVWLAVIMIGLTLFLVKFHL